MIAALPLQIDKGQNLMRLVLFGALAIGLLSLSTGGGTLAYFTTQVQSNNNTFTAGNLHFSIQDSLSTTGQYPSVGSSLSLPNMKPGDVTYAAIQLNNTGSLDAKYGVKYTTTTVLASNSNGGTVSGTTTSLTDSGRTASLGGGNGLSFLAPSYGSLVGDYVLMTGVGTDTGQFSLIAAGTTVDTLNLTTALTLAPDATSVYNVVKYAGAFTAGSTTTVLTDTGAVGWTRNQWVGYTVSIGASSSTVVSNTPTSLTVSPAFGGAPAAAVVYAINSTNLAPALTLGIVGKGAGTGTVADCTPTNYNTPGAFFADSTPAANSAARLPVTVQFGGETVLAVAAGKPLLAAALDVLCMQVNWPEDMALGVPAPVNTYNGGSHGTFATNIDFVFDGQ